MSRDDSALVVSWTLAYRMAIVSGPRVFGVWVAMLCAAPLSASPLRQAPAAATATQPPLTPLTQGVAVERPLAPDESHAFGIRLDAGELAEVSVEQLGIDVIVSIVGPDGQAIEQIDELSEHENPERILLLSGAGGQYRLDVHSENVKGVSAGRYRLTLVTRRPATVEDQTYERSRRTQIETAESLEKTLGDLMTAGKIDPAQLGPLFDELEAPIAFFTAHHLRRRESEALRIQSLVLLVTDQYPRAVAINERRLPWLNGARDASKKAYALNHLAEALVRSGETGRALDAFHEALALPQTPLNEAIVRDNLGATLRRLGRLQEALDAHLLAAEFFKANGRRRSEGIVSTRMAIVWENVGDLPRALEYETRALAIYREVGDRTSEAIALSNIGGWHLLLGNIEQAQTFLNDSLALAESIGVRFLQAHALTGLSRIYNRTGDYLKTIEVATRALAVHQELKESQGEIWTLTELAEAQRRLGKPDTATELLQRARRIADETGHWHEEATALHALARLASAARNLDVARADLEAALERIERARQNLAGAQLRTALTADWLRVYGDYVEVLQALHEQRPSEGFDRLALAANELSRARSLLDTLAASRVDVHVGVEPELQARERDLRQRLNDKDLLWRSARAAAGDRARAEQLAKEVEQIAADLQLVESTVRAKNPAFASLTRPSALTIPEIQKDVLDADTLLLEYALGDDRSWLWIVTKTSFESVALPPRAAIEAAAREAYRWLTARQVPANAGSATARRQAIVNADAALERSFDALSRLLLQPLAARLDGEWAGKRLLVVAPGALEYVPFAALPIAGSAASTQRGTRPDRLLERHEVINLPSASVLAALRRETDGRPRPRQALAVIADPVFDAGDPRVRVGQTRQAAATPVSGDRAASLQSAATDIDRTRSLRALDAAGGDHLARLPFSRVEADAIASLFRPGEVFKATDFAAARDWALSPQLGDYRILHFATHGLVNTDQPEVSSLVFSLVDERGRSKDGFLRLHDIYNLRLPAELVVLSACQTALGKEIGGEGLVGLTRGFMYAGAKRVVASLWQVDDAATAELMKNFYRRMIAEGQPAAAALRSAQLDLLARRQWSSPYFWAAFTIQGEWR